MGDLLQDLRYGMRRLGKSPGFTLVAALTLALGIGANAAIFSVINPILIEPLPYPESDRLVMIWGMFEGGRSQVAFHNFREIAARNHSFERLAIFEPWQPTLAGAKEPERLEGQSVSADYFRVLGISPMLGRDFAVGDDAFHGPKVAMLSYRLWQRRFGGDRRVVGRLVTLDGDAYLVIGVMPREFENVQAAAAEIWSPTQYDPTHVENPETTEWGNHLRLIGRRRAGFSYEQAKVDLASIARTPVEQFPRPRWASFRSGLVVDSLKEDVTRGVRPALLAVFGAVVLVLLIACVNVTNLLLARGTARRGEFAMRAALGASRGRMVRQMLTESILLSVAGGVLGIMVAGFGVQALVALSPAESPRLGAVQLNGAAFVFAFAVSSLIGIAVGLNGNPGFHGANLFPMQVQTTGHQYDDPAATRRFFERALDNVRQLPGVQSAAFTSILPLTDDTEFAEYGTHFEKDKNGYNSFRYVVTPGYFETMRIALKRGRFLDARDRADAPQAVVISESLANRVFGADDPLGQRVHVGPMDRPWYTIVGVVGDVKQVSLAGGLPNNVYITGEQSWFADAAQSLVLRAKGRPEVLVATVQKAIWAVDKDQPIVRISSMQRLLETSAAQRHFVLVLFDAFGLVALALAAIGLYGVIAGSVNERTREIGVRMALGAQKTNIFTLIFRQGLTLVISGVAIGVAVAIVGAKAIRALLYGVSAVDAVTYLGVVLLLAAVSIVACWIPARRAVQLDPMTALRHE